MSWRQGDVLQLPYPDAHFSIVSSRFAFHHLLRPQAALAEMIRVCEPGGRIVVADSAPAASKADAFNAMERLRDPSHVRAFTLDQLRAMFIELGLPEPRIETYRLDGDLDGLLQRSFPNPGDEDRIREIFARALDDDAIDMTPHAAGREDPLRIPGRDPARRPEDRRARFKTWVGLPGGRSHASGPLGRPWPANRATSGCSERCRV